MLVMVSVCAVVDLTPTIRICAPHTQTVQFVHVFGGQIQRPPESWGVCATQKIVYTISVGKACFAVDVPAWVQLSRVLDNEIATQAKKPSFELWTNETFIRPAHYN